MAILICICVFWNKIPLSAITDARLLLAHILLRTHSFQQDGEYIKVGGESIVFSSLLF